MATEKQVEANRRNAQKSTGPKTEEGKANSRANATTHGMTSRYVVPDQADAAQEQRYLDWCPSFTPADPEQEFQLKQVVAASLRIEQCQSIEKKRRMELAAIASDSGPQWDLERKLEASRLGKTLKRDPQSVMLQLRLTPEGRDWLLEHLRRLLLSLPAHGKVTWTDVEANHLLDLLGKSRMLRVALLASPDCPYSDPVAARELILRDIAELEAQQVNAAAVNARLRASHVAGFDTESDAKLKLIRRYEMSAQRQFDKFTIAFRKTQKAPKATHQPTAPKPECETKPIPVAPEAQPTVAPPEVTLPGNRRYRRKLQKEARHEAHLAKQSACRA